MLRTADSTWPVVIRSYKEVSSVRASDSWRMSVQLDLYEVTNLIESTTILRRGIPFMVVVNPLRASSLRTTTNVNKS